MDIATDSFEVSKEHTQIFSIFEDSFKHSNNQIFKPEDLERNKSASSCFKHKLP